MKPQTKKQHATNTIRLPGSRTNRHPNSMKIRITPAMIAPVIVGSTTSQNATVATRLQAKC